MKGQMFLTMEKICSIYHFSLAHLVKINMKGSLGPPISISKIYNS